MSVDVIERPTGVRVDEGHDEREYEPMCRGVLSHLHMSPAIDPKAVQFLVDTARELLDESRAVVPTASAS